MKYPTIIKPTVKSGNRGIYKVDLAEETLTVLKKEEETEEAPKKSDEALLLEEIRDLLKKK